MTQPLIDLTHCCLGAAVLVEPRLLRCLLGYKRVRAHLHEGIALFTQSAHLINLPSCFKRSRHRALFTSVPISAKPDLPMQNESLLSMNRKSSALLQICMQKHTRRNITVHCYEGLFGFMNGPFSQHVAIKSQRGETVCINTAKVKILTKLASCRHYTFLSAPGKIF